MATVSELRELAMHAVKGTAPANFTCDDVNETLRAELKNMVKSVNDFMRYKYDIYDIIIEPIDIQVPTNVESIIGMFAEVRTIKQGDKLRFNKNKLLGKSRARQFLTQVGLSGNYESFRLDHEWFEISVKSIGIACSLDFERMLDGADNMADLVDIATEAMTMGIFQEVQQALQAAASSSGKFPTRNQVINNGFDAKKMMGLITTAKAYGPSVAIFATPEFVGEMGADAIVAGSAAYQGVYSPADIEAIHNTGYIQMFRGTPIIQLPQSFQDETNSTVWVDPQIAYVLPAGNEKMVKVVIEGNTQVWDFTNADQSMEIHMYRKVGVGILFYHNWCIYQNTAISSANGYAQYVAPYANI